MSGYIEILRELLNADAIDIDDLRANPSGIKLVLADASASQLVIDIVAGTDWLVTRHRGARIAIEPRYPEECIVNAGIGLFHVSDASRRNGIQTDGLVPQTGGNTTFERAYPPRSHVCVQLIDALRFAHHQCTARRSVRFDLSGAPNTSNAGPRPLADLDLYRLRSPSGAKYYQDSHFPDGIWTEATFPPSSLELIDPAEWQPLYRALYGQA